MAISNLRVPTTSQIRALEATWIKSVSDSTQVNWGQVLMEIAGRAAAHCALNLWNLNPGHVAVFAGLGNNGGDGLVIARYLNLWGVPASVFIVGEGEMTSAEARANRTILESLAVEVVSLGEDDDLDEALNSITSSASILVDAIFGTGLSSPVEGIHRKVIDAINNSAKPVLAVDIPSGINSDNGQVMGTAVRADGTVTFGFLKPGFLNYPGAEYAGELSLVDIGLPDFTEPSVDIQGKDYSEYPSLFVTTCGAVQGVLPLRPTDSNKGTFGNLLTIAGSLGMSGSGVLASVSALKVGAGLSYLATARSLIIGLPPNEIVYRPLSETSAQTISSESLPEILRLVESCKAVVLGCGMSQNQDTVNLVLSLLDQIDKPCLLDADGLNALSKHPDKLTNGHNFVLTPHPKELSRLLGISVDEILHDRISAVLTAAEKFGCTVVLKGAYSLVASHDGTLYINPTGNSGMSTAGAGDVLSGIIGGLLAQGLSPFDAAISGVYIHGRAGDLALQRHNSLKQQDDIVLAGLSQLMVAGDICDYIPQAMGSVHAGELSYLEQRLAQSVSTL
ncbi:MAG: NAD(P)H-hydrate dehydratase [Candidatus Obscuribacter sp.]|nr:NAD(P)H-hydrate dehydratase [Candidatus Obscuribacter sp.]